MPFACLWLPGGSFYHCVYGVNVLGKAWFVLSRSGRVRRAGKYFTWYFTESTEVAVGPRGSCKANHIRDILRLGGMTTGSGRLTLARRAALGRGRSSSALWRARRTSA